jgi:hypothetical protein
MPKTLKVFGIVLVLFFSSALFCLQLINIDNPPEYVRQDYYMTLSNNVGTIRVNCFDFPAAMFSAYFLHRIVESQGKILLKKDLLVCDFDYSHLNRTTAVANATIWFMNPDANDLTEKTLNLNSTGEQIVFPMAQSGNYMFDVWILRSIYEGWEENFFPNIKFYVYDSTVTYFAAQKTYRLALLTDGLSVFGIISGVFLAAMGDWRSSKKEKGLPKEVAMKSDPETEPGSMGLHTLGQLVKEANALSSIDLVYFVSLPVLLFSIQYIRSVEYPLDPIASTMLLLVFPGALVSLPFGVHASFSGSVAGRIRAWAIFTFLSGVGFGGAIVLYPMNALLPSFFPLVIGFPSPLSLWVTFALGFSLFGGMGLGCAWMRWIYQTFLRRLPSKTSEIEGALDYPFLKTLKLYIKGDRWATVMSLSLGVFFYFLFFILYWLESLKWPIP